MGKRDTIRHRFVSALCQCRKYSAIALCVNVAVPCPDQRNVVEPAVPRALHQGSRTGHNAVAFSSFSIKAEQCANRRSRLMSARVVDNIVQPPLKLLVIIIIIRNERLN